MKTNQLAWSIYHLRQVRRVLAVAAAAGVLFFLSTYASRHLVPCWPAQAPNLNLPLGYR